MTGTYLIADRIIRIDSMFDEVQTQCEAYRASGEPDLAIRITQKDLDDERVKDEYAARAEGRNDKNIPDTYVESLAIYRKIAEWMPGRDTFLFHGSAIAVDGVAYLFTAKSGTGKSTHTRLWRQLLGERAIMVNDDKPLIRVEEGGEAVVYGTPWNGKHHLGNNIGMALKAVCLLERSEENWIRRVSRGEAYPMLVQQAYRPADSSAMAATLRLIDRMNVEFYRLGCNMDISAAELAYETMKG